MNAEGCIEFRINDQVITTGAPVRDHAWHFVAATFDAATGEATLYHEPQVVYALDPEIAPVTKKLAAKLAYAPGTPTVIAGYCGSITDSPQAKASVPSGVLIKGHYNGKIDSPRISSKALTRLEIETMKQGAQPGLSERRNSEPTGKLSETIVAHGNSRMESIPSSARTRGPICSTPPSSTARRGP
jgi:N,N-dimethylformamidase